MYHSIEEIQQAARRYGNSWFSYDNMRIFKTRIHYRVFRGHFFVTSEPDYTRKASTRMFTVHFCTSKGDINTVWDSRSFSSVKQAEKAINALPEKFVQAYELLSSVFNHKWNRDKRTAKVKQAYQDNTTKLDMAIRYIIDNHEDLHMYFVSIFKD